MQHSAALHNPAGQLTSSGFATSHEELALHSNTPPDVLAFAQVRGHHVICTSLSTTSSSNIPIAARAAHASPARPASQPQLPSGSSSSEATSDSSCR